MKRSSIFLFIFFIIGLNHASASVIINEVAWMGTSISANAEWIELFNNGSDAVTLDGWSLKAVDGSPSINLTGTIQPSGYFLLERTSDESVPAVSANQIYSGSLSNSGEDLVLRNNLNEIIDELNGQVGWQAGDNNSKQTMQWSSGAWITAIGTPEAQNQVPEPVTSTTTTSSTSTTSTTTYPVVQSVHDEDRAEIVSVKPDPKYTAKMQLPDFATVGTPVLLSVNVQQGTKVDKISGRFEWYLGDGSAYRYLKNTDFEHVFYYPGDYTVVMEYYSNYFKTEPDSIHKKTITIIPADIVITGLSDDGGVVLGNNSMKEISLDRWEIVQGKVHYLFPKYTIVPKNKSLTVSSEILKFRFTADKPIQLINSNNAVVTSYDVQKNE